MSIIEIVILAVGLAMDAFAVSICKGLAVKELKPKHMLLAGLWFGGFQALMPLVGYFLGTGLKHLIESVDHWIAFVLLMMLGIGMIRSGLKPEDNDDADDKFDVKSMLLMAIATSIDALAVGVTFAFLNVQIVPAISIIGVITFILSAIAVKLGNVFGKAFRGKAEIAGGIVLILIGIKILLEHLGFLG